VVVVVGGGGAAAAVQKSLLNWNQEMGIKNIHGPTRISKFSDSELGWSYKAAYQQ
jgi:shikimate 5-dehydrogenase